MSDQRPEWITRAAEEMTQHAGLDALAAYRHDIAIEKIAEIIARHAPAQATEIGPGDAVQVVSKTHARSWLGIIRERYDNGKWFVIGYGCADTHELQRIGRAKYWPDGSPVEGGGK